MPRPNIHDRCIRPKVLRAVRWGACVAACAALASPGWTRGLSPAEQKALHLRELEITSPELLAKTRRNCAMHLMPKIKSDVEAKGAPLPDVHTYCIKAIDVSARRDLLPDLYINLALQEQGHSEYHFAEQAKLLKDDEAGRTTGLILRAANAGQPEYASVTGKTRQLPCPLALDAGYTWAYRNPEKRQSYEFTTAEIEVIARACYDPSVTEIVLKDERLAASRAGLFAGAWLGRQLRLDGR